MNYPKDIKAFYMRLNDDGKTVAAMDVLAPGIGEIIGGSQREERLDVLDARMAETALDKEDYGGTATCAATARSRTPASASASSAPSRTSLAWPMCATRSRFPERLATRAIDDLRHELTIRLRGWLRLGQDLTSGDRCADEEF